jgi:hypothetical protein
MPPVPWRTTTSQTASARCGERPWSRANERAASALATSKRALEEWNRGVSPRSCSRTAAYSTSRSTLTFSVAAINVATS